MSRYESKPFLKLLDCYVLRAIGHLDPKQDAALKAMEPKLQGIYKQTGSWVDIVAAQMGFPAELPEQIESVWKSGKAKAAKIGLAVKADEFVRQFVDANFDV